MKRICLFLLAVVVLLSCAAITFAAPARELVDVRNGQGTAPILQWFKPVPGGNPVSNSKEFYDNVMGRIIPSDPWGGQKSWHAIGGMVTWVEIDPPSGGIKSFKVHAWVTNDLYDYKDVLTGTAGNNSHYQYAPDIIGQTREGMIDVRFTASFADDGIMQNLPSVPPFGAESNIFAKNYDSLAWYCFYEGMEPPVPQGSGNYWIPTWNFTGPLAQDPDGTPTVIKPGETHYRDLQFGCYAPILPTSPDYNTIMDSYQKGAEIFLNRTMSLKVSDYPDRISHDSGTMSFEVPSRGSDVSVFYNPPKPGSLNFSNTYRIYSHFWYPTADPYNEMLHMMVAADPTEDVQWQTIALQAFGTGNDATDILAVDVWIDNDNNAVVDPIIDQHIGGGVYPLDNGALSITLSPSPLIPASASVPVLISYKMNTAASYFGKTYWFNVSSASGIGAISGASVGLTGLPITSATKVGATKPISIGQAKKLPVGEDCYLEAKITTTSSDFQTFMEDLFYIEESDRSAGIGVLPLSWTGPFSAGGSISLVGHTQLLHGAELIFAPSYIIFGPGTAVGPLGINNRNSGGGAFGGQPAVWDLPGIKQSVGLSSIGLLTRLWGRVTGVGQIRIDGSPTGTLYDVAWIDDGSGLYDGLGNFKGIAVVKPADWTAPDPPTGYIGATGILRAIPGWSAWPVRLLVPRTKVEVTSYPETTP